MTIRLFRLSKVPPSAGPRSAAWALDESAVDEPAFDERTLVLVQRSASIGQRLRSGASILVGWACFFCTLPVTYGSEPEVEIQATQFESSRDACGLLAEAPRLDEGQLAAAGIRKLAGRHLTLYTDVANDAEVIGLTAAFDAAVPHWCRYFEIDPDKTADWRLTGYLIERKEPFRALGLLPADLPPFLHGYQRGDQLWLYEQPTAYYRRHLLLHEGTHAFMKQYFGGAGPPWYMEGVAELLATHTLQDGNLTLGVFPADKRTTPGWGRIKIVKDALAAGNGMTLTRIMQYDARAHLKNEPYGWCWAACAFLDAHPRTRAAFRARREHAAPAHAGHAEPGIADAPGGLIQPARCNLVAPG